jgi:hypothetical protein
VTQFSRLGIFRREISLVERGADLSVCAKLPRHYDEPEEVAECTRLQYATMFPGSENAQFTAAERDVSQ